MTTRTRSALLAAAVAFALQAASPVQANTPAIYTGPAVGSWATAGNWSTNAAPNSSSLDVLIDNGNTAQNSFVTADGSWTVGTLTVDVGDTLAITDNSTITVAGGAITNNGSIIFSTGSAFSNISLVGSVTLTGSGSVTLQNAARFLDGGNGVLINQSTIDGFTNVSGTLGNNGIGIINQGLIDANVTGKPLLVDPSSDKGSLVNQGLMRASNGGILQLTGNGNGGFDNTNGTISAIGTGSIVQFVGGAAVSGGNLTSTNGGLIDFNNATLTNGTLTGNAVVDDNGALTLAGNITNNSTLLLNSTSNFTDLFIAGSVTLGGTGSLVLQNFSRIRDGGSAILVNAAGHTIQGFTGNGGTLGSNAVGIQNQGLIDANVSGQTLLVDPAADKGSLVNSGLMRASNGGILQLTGSGGGGFDNTAGNILATGPGSIVQIVTNAVVTGGTLTATNGGLIQFSNSSITNPTLVGNSVINDNTSLTITGNVVESGNLLINSSTANFADMILNGTVTFSGGGSVILQNFARIRDGGASTLVITPGFTFQGFTLNGGSFGFNNVAIVNQGLIDANVSGQPLVVDPAADKGSLINQGIMRASNGGILQLTGSGGGGFDNTAGSILANGPGSVVQFLTNAIVTGGSITTTNGGLVEFTNASLTNTTLTGTFVQDDNTNLFLTGNFPLNGSLTMNSSTNFTDLYITGSVALTGNGVLTLQNFDRIRDNGNSILTIGPGFTVQGFTSAGGSFGLNNVAFINQGLIDANVSGQTLLVDPSADKGALVNQGLMRARNGGILQLTGSGGGGFDNTNGTISAIGPASLIQLVGSASVTGGSINGISGGSVELSNVNLANVAFTGPVVVDDNTNTFFSGTLSSTGNILINCGTANFTDIFINGTVNFTGGGSVTMQNATRFRDNGNGVLVISPGFTFQGFTSNGGSFGLNNLAIQNQGLIDANVSGQPLIVDPSADKGSLVNSGLMRASNGGILQLTGSGGGGFDNTNGTISAIGPGSLIQIVTNAAVTGGTINGISGGSIEFSNVTLTNVTLNGPSVVDPNTNLFPLGTLTNNGTMVINATNGFFVDIFIAGTVTLAGTGVMQIQNMTRFRDNGSGVLINANGFTIQGSNTGGTFGLNNVGIINQGLINANDPTGQALLIDPSVDKGAFLNDVTGVTRASNGGEILLTGNGGGTFTNNGTFEALNGSSLIMDATAVLTNDVAGVLTLGSYRAIATGNGASMTFQGLPISRIAFNTTVDLSGPVSIIQFGVVGIDTSLVQNDGTYLILNNRSAISTQLFINNGLLQLGGGTFTETTLTNNASASIFGFGSLTNRPLNHGTIESNGGVLILADGINGGSGTIESDSGSTLDLSGGSSGSNGDFLINNGSLTLGANSVSVAKAYTNPNFGVGNSFNKHANVSASTGKILAQGDNTELLSATSLDFGHVHVGTTNTLGYTITNSGTNGPDVLFAIQPTANGGNITDSRLSGPGVTSSNVGPLNIGSTSGLLSVTFLASSAGALTGQTVHIDNNFDNITTSSLPVTGAAYRFALPTAAAPDPVLFGNHHVNDVVAPITVAMTNNVPNDNFSEKLTSTLTNGTSSGITLSGGFTLLAPSSTLTSAYSATLNTTSPGFKSSSATLNFFSEGEAPGTLNNSGLGETPLPTAAQTLTATGGVYRFAAPAAAAPNPITFANHHVGDTVAPVTISMTNNVPNDNFSEKLTSTLTNGTSSGITLAGGFTLLAPGSSLTSAYTATLNTSSPGAKSSAATLNFFSEGQTPGTPNNSGLGETPLPAAAQTITSTGNVYSLATPGPVNQSVYNIGPVHVGDSVTRNPIFSNTSAADGFSETLLVQITGHTANAGVTAGSSNGVVQPNSTNGGFVSVVLDTSAAQLGRTGSQTFHFQSDGTGASGGINDGLGITDLPTSDQTVTLTADVLNYALAGLAKSSGDGSFTVNDPTHLTLDFGTIDTGASVSTALNILNLASGPSDTLSGTFTNNAADFTITGIGGFSGIAAQGSLAGPNISFTAGAPGSLSETLVLHPTSVNSAGLFTRTDLTLTIDANVINPVPEPVSLAVLGLGAAALLLRRKRR